MPAVVATLEIKEGKEGEFEEIMRELAAKVRENESGCSLYQPCKSKTPGTFVVIERYVDQEAFELHSSTDYFKAAAARMASCMSGRPKIELLDEIG